MKNFNKYMSLALASVVGIAFATSCDDSKDNDFVTEYEGAPGVYFSNTANAYLELTEDKNSIIYPVYRDEAGPELTVAIEVYPVENYETDDIYTFPSSVTFAAGSKVADFEIGYDISKAEIGVEQQYELYLDAEPNPFSSNEVVITLVNPAPWTLLGNGEFYDYFFGISDDSVGPAIVTVWQQGLDKNLYRISNPYVAFNGDTDSYFQFRVLQEGDVFFDTTVDQPDLVGYTMYFITYFDYWGSDAYLAFPAYFGLTSTADWADSRVLDYRDDGLPGLIQLAPVYLDYSTGDGYGYDPSYPILIYFPDYEPVDAALNVTYEGILTPSSMQQQVLLSVDLGSDITTARAAVGADSADSLIEAVEEGSIDYTEFNTSGNVKIPFGNGNPTGNYNAVVVAYVGDEVKATSSVKFTYISSSTDYDPNEGWKSLGSVNYTDGFVCSCPAIFLKDPIQTYSVEIQESEETAGLYRLVNPYGAAYPYTDVEEDNPYLSHYLYVDATNPSRVMILESPQDLTLYALDQNDNVVPAATLESCWSLADYYIQNEILTPDQVVSYGWYGSYNNGVITFPRATIRTNQYGQQYLDSSLVANWSFQDEPDDDGMYSANIVMDYQTYVNSNYTDPYMKTLTGAFVAPFIIDMSSLTTEANYRINGQVMLSQKAFKANTPKFITNQMKANKVTVQKSQKVDRQILTKNPEAKLKFQK